jgi:GNAT superfamily N-acetyltransferase
MADAEIVVVGQGELPLIVDLYNDIFRPPKDMAFFHRRLAGRQGMLLLVAQIGGRPVGFSAGIELKPNVFFSWLMGVLPDYRRAGIASQLHDAECAWAKDHGYQYMRMECYNGHRSILQMAIASGFDIVGVRWDHDRSQNLIIFEKALLE